MITISLEEAQAKLPDLIHNLKPGEELIITEKSQLVAKLIGGVSPQRPPVKREVPKVSSSFIPRTMNIWKPSRSICLDDSARHPRLPMVYS